MSAAPQMNLEDHYDTLAIATIAKYSPQALAATFGPQVLRNTTPMGLPDTLRALESRAAGTFTSPQAMLTSDVFTDYIRNVANLAGLVGYNMEAPAILESSHETLMIEDFQPQERARLSAFPALLSVAEGSEVQYGGLADKGESYAAAVFSRLLELSIQAIQNGRLDMVVNPSMIAGRAVADTKASILAGLIEGNPTLRDGLPVFHADHGNLETGAAVTIEGMRASLKAARAKMLRQKDVDGERPAPVTPAFIVVPPELQTNAEQLVADIEAATVETVNPFAGKLRVLTEPRLSDENSWYLFARPEQQMSLEHGTVSGTEDPEIRVEAPIGKHSIITRVSISFGAGWLDHRGAFKITSAGA